MHRSNQHCACVLPMIHDDSNNNNVKYGDMRMLPMTSTGHSTVVQENSHPEESILCHGSPQHAAPLTREPAEACPVNCTTGKLGKRARNTHQGGSMDETSKKKKGWQDGKG